LQRVDWKVIRRLDGLLQGDYRSLFYGYGVDFADLREYQTELCPQTAARRVDVALHALARGRKRHQSARVGIRVAFLALQANC
jgi:hypothetical protein